MRLELGLFGEVQVAGWLTGMENRVVDASSWFRMMHGWLEKELEDQFVTEGRHWGSGWQALSPAYAEQKARDGYGNKPILQREGNLFESLTTRSHPDAIRYTGPTLMVFGSSVESEDGFHYGVSHQLGQGVPKRRMLELLRRADTRRVTRSLGLFITRDEILTPSDMFGGVGGRGA